MGAPKDDDIKHKLRHTDVNQRMHKIILKDNFATGQVKKKNVPRRVNHRIPSLMVPYANEEECVFSENRKLNVQPLQILSPIWSVCTRTDSEGSNLGESRQAPNNECLEGSSSTICPQSSLQLQPTVVMCTIPDDGKKTKKMTDRATSMNFVKFVISNAIQTSPYHSIKAASYGGRFKQTICGCQYYIMKPEPRVPVCSYTDCPSEVVQKITNFDSINAVNRTSTSLTPHIVFGNDELTGHKDIITDNTVNLKIDNISTAKTVKACSNKSECENRQKKQSHHHSSNQMAPDKSGKGESDSWSSYIPTDESTARTASAEQLIKAFLDGDNWKSKQMKRIPGYRYNFPGFEILSKKISVQCFSRKQLDRAWKKTLQRWACSLGAQGKQRKRRKHNKCCHRPEKLDNVIVQTSVPGCQETGTDGSAIQQKSTAFSAIFNKDCVQSFCNQMDGILSGKHLLSSSAKLSKSLSKIHSYPPILFRNNNNMVNFQWRFKNTTHTATSALRLDPESHIVLEKATSALLFNELKQPQKCSKSICCKSLDVDTKNIKSKNSSQNASLKHFQQQLDYNGIKDMKSKFSRGPSFLSPVYRSTSEKTTSYPGFSELMPPKVTESVMTQETIPCERRGSLVPSRLSLTHANGSTNTSGEESMNISRENSSQNSSCKHQTQRLGFSGTKVMCVSSQKISNKGSPSPSMNTKVSLANERDISTYDLAQDPYLYNVLNKLIRGILTDQSTRNGGSIKTCISTNTNIEIDDKGFGPTNSFLGGDYTERESKGQQCQPRRSLMNQQPTLVARSQVVSTINMNQLMEEESTQTVQETILTSNIYTNRRMSMGTSTHGGLDYKCRGPCVSNCKNMKRCQCVSERKDMNTISQCTNTSLISAIVQKPTLVARSQFVCSLVFKNNLEDGTQTEPKSYHTVALPNEEISAVQSLAETIENDNSEKVALQNKEFTVNPLISQIDSQQKQDSEKGLFLNESDIEKALLAQTQDNNDSEKAIILKESDAEMLSLTDSINKNNSEKGDTENISQASISDVSKSTLEQIDSGKASDENSALTIQILIQAPPASILTQDNIVSVLHVTKSNTIMHHLDTTDDGDIKRENPIIMVKNGDSTSDNNVSNNFKEFMMQAYPDLSDKATEMVLPDDQDQSTSTTQFVLSLHEHCHPPPKMRNIHSIVKMLLTPSSGTVTEINKIGVQKRSVCENRSCRTSVKTESLIATNLSSRLFNPGNSLTNISKHDKDELRSVYFLLSSIEGRMRRLKSNMPKGKVLSRH